MPHSEIHTLVNTMKRAAESIGEHADSVLILVSASTRDGHCAFADMGVGNRHAHEGLVREWLRRKEGYDLGYFATQGMEDSPTKEEL